MYSKVILQPHVSRMPLARVLLSSTISTILGAPTMVRAQASDATSTALSEVVVTAERRSENLQSVPASILVLGDQQLTQLDVNNASDYFKFLPSVTIQTYSPSETNIDMRGVTSGGSFENYQGPTPTVGLYLDEQPITTIAGALDVHMYDIARIEVLPGPQGTLYGASSEAGTMRIITNQPSTSKFSAGYDLEGNTVDHGSQGYVAEGYVNVPLNDRAAIRLVAFDEHDAGFIDNVPATRTYATSGATINNSGQVRSNFNPVHTYGGRAAGLIDVNDDWTITPTFMAQHQLYDGRFEYEPSVGFLETQQFLPNSYDDEWYQGALTVKGKISNFDVTYSGGYFQRRRSITQDYTDYSVAYDQLYGEGASWTNSQGAVIANPSQTMDRHDVYTKYSNELHVASPQIGPFRFIAGLFQEQQTHDVIQQYTIPGLAEDVSIPGYPGTFVFLGEQRVDRDVAAFTEATLDITSKLSLTAGVRGYYYDNTQIGFNGFSNVVSGCILASSPSVPNVPCINLDGTARGSGATHKVNLTYKVDSSKLIYFTYSTGYRPGGVNIEPGMAPYHPDYLTNYEVGFKTSWFDRRLTFDGAAYYEDWSQFQFSYIGPGANPIFGNAPDAAIKGAEASLEWTVTRDFRLSSSLAYNDARITQNFCGTNTSTGAIIPNCTSASAVIPNDKELPYTPPFKGNVIGRYTFPMGDWQGHLQGALTYQTSAPVFLRTQDSYLGYLPAYGTGDLTFGVQKDGLSIEAFAKNVTDSEGQLNHHVQCPSCGVVGFYVVPIQPRTVGIRLGQKF